MIYLRKWLNIAVYFFANLILFTSCVIYHKYPSSLEESKNTDVTHLKIQTVDGDVYKLRWIDEDGDSIVSIKNTRKRNIEIHEIRQIYAAGDELQILSLDSAYSHTGELELIIKNKRIPMVKIEPAENHVIGFEKLSEKIYPVRIPIDQIEEIRLINQSASKTCTTLTFVIPVLTLIGFGIARAMQNWDFFNNGFAD
jgi:hypothetical protein